MKNNCTIYYFHIHIHKTTRTFDIDIDDRGCGNSSSPSRLQCDFHRDSKSIKEYKANDPSSNSIIELN